MAEGQRSSLITEVLIDGQRFSYGTPRNINPRLYGADPEGKALGWIVEGSWIPYRKGANGAMLVEKKIPGMDFHLEFIPEYAVRSALPVCRTRRSSPLLHPRRSGVSVEELDRGSLQVG